MHNPFDKISEKVSHLTTSHTNCYWHMHFVTCMLKISWKGLNASKGIGVIKILSNMLPQHSLITMYKAFVRPHFDYRDILYEQPNNESLCQKTVFLKKDLWKNWKYSIQCCFYYYTCHLRYISDETLQWMRLWISQV